MYNAKSIENFMSKVHEEAEKAAQEIYDKYNLELLKRIQNQINKNDVVWVGNGTGSIENKNGDDIAEELCVQLGQLQYWSKNISAGFSLPYNFNKTEIIKE